MAHHDACCKLPPIVSEYKEQGSHVTLDNGFDAYITGPVDANRGIVLNYDIFGYWATTKQFADLLANAAGARLVMPDIFKGKPWPLSNFPPKDGADLGKWIRTEGAWEKTHPVLESAAAYLHKLNGCEKVGLVGMCWGAKIASLAGKELGNKFSAIVCLHPAMFTHADVEACKVPMCVLPSMDENKAEMDKVEEAMKKAPWAAKGAYRYFADMHHGWCAARADFGNELNRKRTHEALELVVAFFGKNLH